VAGWTPASAAATTSSNPTGAVTVVTAPVASREESRRLSTSPVSRSADSSTVASSSWRSSAGIRSTGSRRLPAAALIAVSGVRRSWPTAESSAVRSPAASARRCASVAWAAIRRLRRASSA
jgi:hypothetical protein